MFSLTELKILASPPPEYPLLVAAAKEASACRKCSHRNVNVHGMLQLAINKYRRDKRFLDYVDSAVGLPCSIAGIYLTRKDTQ